ncbi:DUF6804 family protein [Paludibaculum fermentans]|uniref:DUF6804 family protein n=1 Tax=Paludibaculum fermentans TaxID=1473598 RepID=UPI003EB6B33F
MSTTTEQKEVQPSWVVPDIQPLNQSMWRAWEAKGQYQDRQASRSQGKAIYLVSMAALLAAAVLWSNLPPYEVVVRFIVCIGAVTAASQAYQLRRFATVAVFALLIVLFNPILPVLIFAGEWQRVIVLLSMIPFGFSFARLISRSPKNA